MSPFQGPIVSPPWEDAWAPGCMQQGLDLGWINLEEEDKPGHGSCGYCTLHSEWELVHSRLPLSLSILKVGEN